RRGRILEERRDLQGARREFLAASAEAARYELPDVRQGVTVDSHTELGIIAWRSGEYREGLRWLRQAEEEQTRFRGNWVPDLAAHRRRLEAMLARLPPGHTASPGSSDPMPYYHQGAQYLDAADRLGVTPRGTPLAGPEARRLASIVWAGDPRLPALLSEWSQGLHGGPVETIFQERLRALAWEAFESALHAKGTRAMPDLYSRRGTILWARGDLQGARKEFLT